MDVMSEPCRMMPLDAIKLSGENMRLDPGEIKELAQSIRSLGLLQPLVVNEDDVLVCGHRRLAACRLVGLDPVPVVVRDLTGDDAFVALLTENLHRKSLTPLEEAHALKRLADAGRTGQEIADLIHKSPMYVSTHLALLTLDEDTQQAVHNGEQSVYKAVEAHRKVYRPRNVVQGASSTTERWQGSYIDRIIGWVTTGGVADDKEIEDKLRTLYRALRSYFGITTKTDDETALTKRVCRMPDCETQLSRFNKGIYCGPCERKRVAAP